MNSPVRLEFNRLLSSFFKKISNLDKLNLLTDLTSDYKTKIVAFIKLF